MKQYKQLQKINNYNVCQPYKMITVASKNLFYIIQLYMLKGSNKKKY